MHQSYKHRSGDLSTNNRLHGRVVKCVGHLGHDEAMEAGGRGEFEPRPGHYVLVQPGNWYGFLI